MDGEFTTRSLPTSTSFGAVFKTVKEEIGIAGLRLSLAHVPSLTEQQILDQKSVGAGVTLQDRVRFGTSGGPPTRTNHDLGLRDAGVA